MESNPYAPPATQGGIAAAGIEQERGHRRWWYSLTGVVLAQAVVVPVSLLAELLPDYFEAPSTPLTAIGLHVVISMAVTAYAVRGMMFRRGALVAVSIAVGAWCVFLAGVAAGFYALEGHSITSYDVTVFLMVGGGSVVLSVVCAFSVIQWCQRLQTGD